MKQLDILRALQIPTGAEKIYLETRPAWFVWKDENAKCLGCTPETAAICNSSIENILGKDELEHDGVFQETARKFFLLEDQHVLKTQRKYIALGSFNYADTKRHLCYTKETIWDEKTQKNVLLGVGVEIPEHFIRFFNASLTLGPPISHNPTGLHFSNTHFASKEHGINLSAREEECLFFLLRGHASKNIADFLKISSRTVEFHLNNIKEKFGCMSKSALLKTAIELGYQSLIPERFLNI
jgi:DNA-binding CsgD family transcriptional regulator